MKVFDLTEKFTTEKPILKIGSKVYEIDNSTETALKVGNIDTTKTETQYIFDFLEITIGKKAIEEINFNKYPLSAVKEVFYAVTSAITEEDVETIRTRFQNSSEE